MQLIRGAALRRMQAEYDADKERLVAERNEGRSEMEKELSVKIKQGGLLNALKTLNTMQSQELEGKLRSILRILGTS